MRTIEMEVTLVEDGRLGGYKLKNILHLEGMPYEITCNLIVKKPYKKITLDAKQLHLMFQKYKNTDMSIDDVDNLLNRAI